MEWFSKQEPRGYRTAQIWDTMRDMEVAKAVAPYLPLPPR